MEALQKLRGALKNSTVALDPKVVVLVTLERLLRIIFKSDCRNPKEFSGLLYYKELMR
jgi:hypothetical protein